MDLDTKGQTNILFYLKKKKSLKKKNKIKIQTDNTATDKNITKQPLKSVKSMKIMIPRLQRLIKLAKKCNVPPNVHDVCIYVYLHLIEHLRSNNFLYYVQ